MKRILVALGLSLMVSLQACAQVELWQEGKHYKVISETATAKPVVTEFFSFWCPACFNAEPLVAEIKKQLPEGVSFNKVHVNFMGSAGPDTQDAATKAMMIARALKQEDTLNAAIFNYIHRQRAIVANLDDLRNLFIVNGVEPEKFDKMAASFSINSLVNRNNKTLADFRAHVNGVPNFIVNGKFQATFTRDMTGDDIVNLIVWLSKQK